MILILKDSLQFDDDKYNENNVNVNLNYHNILYYIFFL